MLEIKESPGKGRGVFLTTSIAEGHRFERSPVIEIPRNDIIRIRRTIISKYYFRWGEKRREGAIALGFGSLFNHSYNPNAVFQLNNEDKTIDFYSLRPISAGEEITINYNGSPDDKSKLWFSPID